MGTLSFDGSQFATPVGHYSYEVQDDLWTWSDAVYVMHGYAPQSVPASTELMLRHKHPDDMARVFDVLESAAQDGEPFACYHRIVDAQQKVRSVLSVGRGVEAANGQVARVTGFFVDLTELQRAEVQVEVDEALRRLAETRAVIEQAKGMIMAATGGDAEEAFGVLRHYSSHRNIKLNELAHRLVRAAQDQPRPEGRPAVFDVLEGLDVPSGRTAN